jgi:hypothetical protein
MNKVLNKADWAIPLVLSCIYFSAIVLSFSRSIFVALAVIAAIYYTPYRFFFNKLPVRRLLHFLSCFICSLILVLSAVYLINSSSFYEYSVMTLCIINFVFLIILLCMKEEYPAATIHFCFQIFVSGVAFIGY